MVDDPDDSDGAEHLITQVKVSAFRSSHWEDAVRCWALSYRDALAKHTPLIPVIAVLPGTDAPKTLAMYEEVSAGLLKAGFPEDIIIPVIAALEAFIFGAAFDVNAPEGIFNPGALAQNTSRFSAAVAHRVPGKSNEHPSDIASRLGLDALIKGLSNLRKPPVSHERGNSKIAALDWRFLCGRFR